MILGAGVIYKNLKYEKSTSGWTDWTKADGVATLGTVGQALRIEAIQFR